jgi:Zn finger protein HypA/HybF involved in hydrogenase expression
MEEILFWIVYCQACSEISVTDTVPDEGDVDCPACKGGDVRVKAVTPSTFDDFMISTNVQLWQLFARKAGG